MIPYYMISVALCARPKCVNLRRETSKYCSRRCSNRLAFRAYKARKSLGIPSRPFRRWRAGDAVGDYVLVRRHKPNGSDYGHWIGRCQTCGNEAAIQPITVVNDKSRCRACWESERTLPRLCKSCGTDDLSRFGNKATECMACDRAAHRNGRCSCGRAVLKTRDCACGRLANNVATRILRAVDALHAVGVAPTKPLLRAVVRTSTDHFRETLHTLTASGRLQREAVTT